MRKKGGAQAVQHRVIGLNRRDLRVLHLRGRDQACTGLRTIHQHGAGAAIAGLAADLGAGEAKALAQRVRQGRKGGGLRLDARAVQREGDHASPRSRSRSSVSAASRR